MARVFIPTMLQTLTEGVKEVEFPASNVRQVIQGLEERFPGIGQWLTEDGRIKPNLAVAIDGETSSMGLLAKGWANVRSSLHTRHFRRVILHPSQK